jgi:hypothetical protein
MQSINKIVELEERKYSDRVDSDEDEAPPHRLNPTTPRALSDPELNRDGGGPSKLLSEAELKAGLNSIFSAKQRNEKRSFSGHPFVTKRKQFEERAISDREFTHQKINAAFKPPTFYGLPAQDPTEFIRGFKTFINMNNVRDIRTIFGLFESCLGPLPAQWLSSIPSYKIQTLDGILKCFQEKYQNKQDRNLTKSNILRIKNKGMTKVSISLRLIS